MSTPRKPRSDSKLKTLREDRQAAIVDYLRDHSLPQTATWLRANGLQTSVAGLSEFFSWYHLRQQLKRNESTVQTILDNLHQSHPSYTSQQLQELGQTFFTALALEQQDVKSWFLTQRLRLQEQQISLDRDRFERETCETFLKWFRDQRAREIAESTATNEEKIQLLRRTYFADVDALEKSGQVKLPK